MKSNACWLLLCLMIAVPMRAQEVPDPETSSVSNAPDPDRLGHYPSLLLDDSKFVFGAPLRADSDDWLKASLAAVAVLGTGLVLDRPLNDAFQRSRTDGRDKAAQRIEKFGGEYSFAIIGGTYLYGVAFSSPEAKATAIDSISTCILTEVLIVPAMKMAVGRARPTEGRGPDFFHPFTNRESFPSGHTTQAFSVASVISAHSTEPWVPYAAYGLASLVGIARMEQNAHFASDVLAGAIIGTTVGRAVTHCNQALRTPKRASWDLQIVPDLRPGYRGAQVRLQF